MFRVVLLPGLDRFSCGWVVFRVFFCFQRTFPGRVYLRVSYGSVWLRFFSVESCFAPRFG